MAWKKILLEGDAAELTSSTPEAIVEDASGAVGTDTTAARSDHVHASPSDWTPASHKTDHENGGGDEISVAGLSGELADDQPPKSHASDHKDGGSDEILLHELGEPTGVIDINQQQLDGAVLEVAASAPDVASEVEGQIYYNSADDHPYVFVAA